MPMASSMKRWTLRDLHSLPDDGNKYEVIHGDLFVTPAPSVDHEAIISRLASILQPYVQVNGLGMIFYGHAVIRHRKSEVEPDLMVRAGPQKRRMKWEDLPLPILVVEVISPTTRRREHEQKRKFYRELGIPEYWIVDPENDSIRVVKPGHDDEVTAARLTWHPRGASAPLNISVPELFG